MVLVSDINDNAPVFQESSYSTAVSETLSVGSEVLNLLATDADYGSNAHVTYTIEQQIPSLAGLYYVYTLSRISRCFIFSRCFKI